jgi:hypothetical protein
MCNTLTRQLNIVQSGNRVIVPHAISTMGIPQPQSRMDLVREHMAAGNVLMMGDNPELPPLPERPTLIDFLKLRVEPAILEHMLQSAQLALSSGHSEKIVLACLIHDISVGSFVSAEHGFWAAQLIAPYVDEEIAWAVQHHQPFRYFADPAVGYDYPKEYIRYFGEDYVPPAHVKNLYEQARSHKWYMTARILTINDVYSWDPEVKVTVDDFADIVGRNFRQPAEGLGFDGSPSAHMWRTLNWPNNAL